MLSPLEEQVLESIAKRESIRFVRVSRTLIEQGDGVGAVVVSLTPIPNSRWEAELVVSAVDEDWIGEVSPAEVSVQ